MSPPFSYSGYSNPYVQSMTALLQRPGDIEAQRAMTVAQAQGNAAQQSGQAYGNAIQGAGQAIAAIPQQIQQQKMEALKAQDIQGQIAERNAQAAERVQKAADLKALDTAYQQPGGREAILSSLPGHLKPTVQAQFDSSDKAHSEAQKAQEEADRLTTEAFADTASSIKAHGYDPVAAQLAISEMKLKYQGNPQRIQQLKQMESALQQNPTPGAIKALVDPIIMSSPNRAKMAQEQPKIDAEVAKLKAEANAGPKPSAEQDTMRATDIRTRLNLKQPISPEDAAWLKSHETEKTLGVDLTAGMASNRQATAIAAQTAQQARAQTFQEQQQGRKELTEKVEQPYQTAASSAQTLRDTVALAKNGNMSAAALQNLETTMAAIRSQGLNRINTTEIGVSANAGSLWDNIVGKVGKLTAGQPVDAALQKDMQQFAGMLEKAAYQKYLAGHTSLTKRYGLSDEKPLAAPNIYVRDKAGMLHTAPYGTPIPPGASEE